MSKIEEFKVYKTKVFGDVKVLKKTSTTYKSQPGKIRVKCLNDNSMNYISEDEFIFPAIKSKLTASERKDISRKRKKEAGEIEISIRIKISHMNKIQEIMPDLNFSQIVENLIEKVIFDK